MILGQQRGLVMPEMANLRSAPLVKVPAVIVKVSTPPAMVLVPAPPAPTVTKVRVPSETTASPAALSVIMILPSVGIGTAGVSCTVMVTLQAPLTEQLRAMKRPTILLNRAGTEAPALSMSANIFTVRLLLLLAWRDRWSTTSSSRQPSQQWQWYIQWSASLLSMCK